MAVSTEKIIPGVLPPKEETEGVDFLAIYDGFDAASLSDEQLKKFAPRNPYITAHRSEERYYKIDGKTYPVPHSPITERLHHGEFCIQLHRRNIEAEVARGSYKNARAELVKAIGIKACTEYVRRQYDSMSEEEIEAAQAAWDRWSRYCDERQSASYEDAWEERPYGYTIDTDWKHHQKYIPLMCIKLKNLRKNVRLTQHDFAKRIGYNVNKYAQLEQGKLEKLGLGSLREAFPPDFIKSVADATYANPYWLEDNSEEGEFADSDLTAISVDEAHFPRDEYPMFVDVKVIRYWWGHHL